MKQPQIDLNTYRPSKLKQTNKAPNIRIQLNTAIKIQTNSELIIYFFEKAKSELIMGIRSNLKT
jgi:hypothetical protein